MVKKPVKPKFKKLDPKIEKMLSMSEVGVLLENINDNIKLVAEGHLDLRRDIDNLSGRMDKLENRFDALEMRVYSIEQEIKSGFKAIIDFMHTIDMETTEIKNKLATKIDKNEYIVIEQRVIKLELEVRDCQKMIDGAKKP